MAKSPFAVRLMTTVAVLVAAGGCALPDAGERRDGDPPPTAQSLSYTVAVDRDSPLRLEARLDLPLANPGTRTAFVRGLTFGLESQVSLPRCDGTDLVATGDGVWEVPSTCEVLSWSIDLKEARPNEVDASLQKSLYFAERGWWMLSEPTSLLRLGDFDPEASLVLTIEGLADSDAEAGASRMDAGAWRVPSIANAPEFFAFGELALQHHDLGRMHTTYVIDDVDRFKRLPLLEMHKQALSYLAEVFDVPQTVPEQDRHLLVVWLGIDETLGEAGGAAGSRSFLANYVDGDEEGLSLNAARTMLVVAHEQAHQLHDLMWRGGPPVATWVGESLAHYYGLMALARSGLPEGIVAIPMDAFIDPHRPVEAGLVEYQRRYASGDQDAYGMFYFQGATFWAEADRILRSTSPEAAGLDPLIPAFLNTADSVGEGLPASFRAILLERGGPEMSELLARFVGE